MNYRIKRHMSDFFLFFQLNLRLLIWFLFVGTSWCKKKEAAFAAAVVVQLCPCSNIVSVNKWLCTARNIWTMRFILCSPNIQKNPLTIQWCRILNIFALSHFTDMNLIHQHVFLQLCCSCLSLLQFPLTEALRRFKYFSVVVHHHSATSFILPAPVDTLHSRRHFFPDPNTVFPRHLLLCASCVKPRPDRSEFIR